MGDLAAGFVTELRALGTVRRYRILILLFLTASFVSMEIYRGQVVSELPVAVLDLDGSRPSRAVRLALEATRDVRVLPEAPSSMEDAAALLRSGEAAAVVVMPQELSTEIKRGHRGHVVVAVDMSNILIGKIASKSVSRVLATTGVGLQMITLEKMGERPSAALAHAAPLVVDESFTFNPTTSYAAYMAPALTFFFLHLTLLILACSIGLPPAPARSASDAAGRGLALVVFGVAGAALLAYVYLPHEGIVMRSGPGVLLAVAAASAAAIVAMSMAALALTPRPLLGFQIALLVGMVSMMVSGATWPSDALPPLLRTAAAALPFTALTRGYRAILPQQVTLAEIAPVLRHLGLQVAGWGALAVTALVLRRALARRPQQGDASC